MPATRRSSRAAAAKKTGRQSTLSFNNRVSKPGAAKASAKEAADAVTPPPSSLAKKAVAVEPVAQEDDEDEDGKDEQPETLDEDADEGRITTAVQVEQRPAVEVKAERVTDAQIKRYWRDVEDARIAKRVHQEDLSLAEKVLRYFDISSQYGPCIGIPRMKRWHRAEKLGLKPPVEVLAVLLKEEKRGHGAIETSAMDRHLSSTAVGSG